MSALVRYHNPDLSLSDWFEELLGDGLYSRSGRDITSTSWPRVDIVEDDAGYTLHADIPGMDKKDIRVTVENGVLTISGEKKTERKDKKKGSYEYYERSYGAFSRSFNLPEHVNADAIDASYGNGVLELKLKKTADAKPRQIDIKVN